MMLFRQREEENLMNSQFMQAVLFDWNKNRPYSYLKEIEALKGIERLKFNHSIAFFVRGNGGIFLMSRRRHYPRRDSLHC